MIMHVMCIEILASEKTRLLSDFIYVLPLANSRNISGKKRKHTHTHTHFEKKLPSADMSHSYGSRACRCVVQLVAPRSVRLDLLVHSRFSGADSNGMSCM